MVEVRVFAVTTEDGTLEWQVGHSTYPIAARSVSAVVFRIRFVCAGAELGEPWVLQR